jgi:hypothetical protein
LPIAAKGCQSGVEPVVACIGSNAIAAGSS